MVRDVFVQDADRVFGHLFCSCCCDLYVVGVKVEYGGRVDYFVLVLVVE